MNGPFALVSRWGSIGSLGKTIVGACICSGWTGSGSAATEGNPFAAEGAAAGAVGAAGRRAPAAGVGAAAFVAAPPAGGVGERKPPGVGTWAETVSAASEPASAMAAIGVFMGD